MDISKKVSTFYWGYEAYQNHINKKRCENDKSFFTPLFIENAKNTCDFSREMNWHDCFTKMIAF